MNLSLIFLLLVLSIVIRFFGRIVGMGGARLVLYVCIIKILLLKILSSFTDIDFCTLFSLLVYNEIIVTTLGICLLMGAVIITYPVISIKNQTVIGSDISKILHVSYTKKSLSALVSLVIFGILFFFTGIKLVIIDYIIKLAYILVVILIVTLPYYYLNLGGFIKNKKNKLISDLKKYKAIYLSTGLAKATVTLFSKAGYMQVIYNTAMDISMVFSAYIFGLILLTAYNITSTTYYAMPADWPDSQSGLEGGAEREPTGSSRANNMDTYTASTNQEARGRQITSNFRSTHGVHNLSNRSGSLSTRVHRSHPYANVHRSRSAFPTYPLHQEVSTSSNSNRSSFVHPIATVSRSNSTARVYQPYQEVSTWYASNGSSFVNPIATVSSHNSMAPTYQLHQEVSTSSNLNGSSFVNPIATVPISSNPYPSYPAYPEALPWSNLNESTFVNPIATAPISSNALASYPAYSELLPLSNAYTGNYLNPMATVPNSSSMTPVYQPYPQVLPSQVLPWSPSNGNSFVNPMATVSNSNNPYPTYPVYPEALPWFNLNESTFVNPIATAPISSNALASYPAYSELLPLSNVYTGNYMNPIATDPISSNALASYPAYSELLPLSNAYTGNYMNPIATVPSPSPVASSYIPTNDPDNREISEVNIGETRLTNSPSAVNRGGEGLNSAIVISSPATDSEHSSQSSEHSDSDSNSSISERVRANIALADFLQAKLDNAPVIYRLNRRSYELKLKDVGIVFGPRNTTPELYAMGQQIRRVMLAEGWGIIHADRAIKPLLIDTIRNSEM